MAVNVIKSGWVAQGSEVEQFEDEICDFLGVQRGLAVAVSSGTAALYLALLALDAKGKTVAYPAYTCSALRNATAMAGGVPSVIDSRTDLPNMSIPSIGKSTNIAIIPHMYGLPQKIIKGMSPTKIIEDCAQSLGAYVDKGPAGLQGDIGVFSFFATKLITTGGQGGMVVSKDVSIIEEIKDYRLFDRRRDSKNRFNFQMTDLQAAIGRAQLRKFPSFIARREEIYQQYKHANLPLLDVGAGIEPVRFRAILLTKRQNEIIDALKQQNIASVIPLQDWELLGDREHFPHAYDWTQRTISLPIYPTLTDEDVNRIIKVVTEFL